MAAIWSLTIKSEKTVAKKKINISTFPSITGCQVALISNDLYTGVIVNKKMQWAKGGKEDVWTVYNEIEEAIKEADRIVTAYDHIECMIFGEGKKLLKHITPS